MSGYRNRAWRLVTAGIGLVLAISVLFSTPATFAATGSATSSVDTIKITAGQTITVQANGFWSSERVTSWASSARGSVYPTLDGTADSSGNVSLRIPIGRFWEPGWWAITVHGAGSDRQTISTFEVVAAAPDGRLDVEPATVPAGSRISFHGAGFTDGESISIWATRPDQAAISVSTDLHSHNGEIYFSYVLPAEAASGEWAMTAYGQTSGRFLIVPFTVTR